MRRAGPGAILLVLSCATLPVALLQALISPALPVFQREFGSTTTATTWLVTSYLLSFAVVTPILGRLGDLYGQRRVLSISLVAMCAATAVAAVAESLPLLIAARVFQGLGGGLFPLGFAIIRMELPAARVPGAIGALSAVLGVGAGLGVAASGLIVDHLGHEFLFWIPLALLAAALVATLAVIPRSPPAATGGRINWAAATWLSGGLTAVLLAITQTSKWGWGDWRTLLLFAGGGAGLAAWIRVELRADEPLVDMRMMRIRAVWTTNLVAALLNVGLFTAFVLIPQFAVVSTASGYGFGASATQAGLLLFPLSVLMFLVGPTAGRLERRWGSRPPLAAGCAIATIAYILLLAGLDDKTGVYFATGLVGIGMGLAYGAATNVIVQSVPPDQTGVATGMITVARSVGATVAAQLTATFLATSIIAGRGEPTLHAFREAFLLAGVALACAAAAALTIPVARRGPPALSVPSRPGGASR